MPANRNVSAAEVEQIGRMLLPVFREAVHDDLEMFKRELLSEIRESNRNMNKRVRILEIARWKAMGAFLIASGLWVGVAEWIRSRFLR